MSFHTKSDNILVSFVGNHKNDNLKKLSNSITHLLRALKGDRNILAEMFNDYVGMNRSDESETAEDLDTLNTDKWLAGCTKMINAIKDYEPKCPPGWVTARSISPFEFEFYMPESEKTKVRLMNRNCDRDYLSEVSRDLLINSIIPCMFKSMGDVEPGTVRDNNVLVDIDRYIIVFNQ